MHQQENGRDGSSFLRFFVIVESDVLARVGIIEHLLGPLFGDFAHNFVRMERFESENSLNLRLERCPIIPNYCTYEQKNWQKNRQIFKDYLKNPAYGRHQLSRPMRIVGPIQI